MSLAVLTINDAGLQLAVDGELVRTSPGYAVLDGENLLIGEAGANHAKLLPRWTNNRFWNQLDTNPIQSSSGQVRHHADLAFAHLEALWQPIKANVDRVMIVVPGHFEEEQLGLLLGMANACEMPVEALVDQSLVAAADLPLAETVLHLDIELHCITLTRISNSGVLVRQQVDTVVEQGLFTLTDRWANAIATQFIQATRFDPMHNAESEQQLYDRLPGWIKKLDATASTHAFEMELDGTVHTVSVSEDTLLKACSTIFPKIVQAIRTESERYGQVSLLLSHHFQGVPGLSDSLGLLNNVEIKLLAETKSTGSASLHETEILGDPGVVNHVVQLNAGDLIETDKKAEATRPTHLLWQHQARPIGQRYALSADFSRGPNSAQQPIATVYLRGEQLLLECHDHEEGPGLLHNGEPANTGAALAIGDTLSCGAHTFTLISVSTDG